VKKDQRIPWWEGILRGERNSLIARSVRRAARIGSLGYEAGMRGREMAYARGWLKTRRLPRPTVCVGNITVGGTGKTPLVIRLAQDLLERGMRPAILMRGYKREKVLAHPVVVRDAGKICSDVPESGDEAMELAIRLPGVVVGVGADRFAVGSHLLSKYPIDCFVLDDGFQHYRLGRDLNIVTLDVTDPWGGGHLLPAGLLRESPSALQRAHAVVLTRTRLAGPDRLSVLEAEVSSYLRQGTPIFFSHHEPQVLIPLKNGRRQQPLATLKGRSVVLVCGIGNPQSFEATVRQEGAIVEGIFRLADHGGRPGEVWKWIERNSLPSQYVVMTEKDSIRWRTRRAADPALENVYALRMNLVITKGQAQWKKFVDSMCKAHAPD
jgi:tetraacyldisaccharide 4'-kinase